MLNEQTRRCNQCGITKPHSAFNRNKSKKHGINYTCRDCHNIQYAHWKNNNRAHLKDYHADYYTQNPDKFDGYAKTRRERKNATLWSSFRANCTHNHKLTVQQAEALRAAYDRCPICKTVFDWDGPTRNRQTKWAAPSIDHLVPVQCDQHRYIVANVSVLCMECNTVKRHHDADTLEHLVAVGALGPNWLNHVRLIRQAEAAILGG